MTEQIELSIVRIRASDGRTVGAGFLVTEGQVLTCAHVVAAALDLPEDTPETPQAAVHLDFPLVAPGNILTARIIHWQSESDVAGLELDGDPPADARPVRLVTARDLWAHAFRAFGFPSGYDDGVWASGVLRGRQAAGWVQIEDSKQTGYFVQPGFSGGPVWDDVLDGVAGMTIAADTSEGVRAAFIIPTDVLIKTWPALSERTITPCPYRGLFPFREQDAPFFFGREAFTDRLVEAVGRKSLVAVIGPSGSGKSSVVFAGLLPRLRAEGSWLIASFRPGDRPYHALATALIPLLEPELSATKRLAETNSLAQALQQGKIALRDVWEHIVRRSGGGRLLLIADQFEELYTLFRGKEARQRFLDVLLATLNAQPQSPPRSSLWF